MALLLLSLIAVVAVVGLVLISTERDVAVIVTLFLVALYAINARWIIPGAGAVGTPAAVFAVLASWWWWVARPTPHYGFDRAPNPMRVALLSYLWVSALSWGLASTRPLSEIEVNGANRALISAIGLTGIALLIADGVDTRRRLDAITRRVAVAGGAFSIVGLLQFFAGLDLVAMIRFPFLTHITGVQSLSERSTFRRAEGTALHSIEFSVVLAMVLPLAVYWAMNAETERDRRRYAGVSAIIVAGIPLSVSRSAVLAVAVALVVMASTWPIQKKVVGFITALGATVMMWMFVPGLIGTLRSLFTSAGNDPSVTARIERVPRVLEEVTGAAWFGSGIGTFSADEDFLLDNQYFETLIEMGIVGLVLVVSLFAAGLVLCAMIAWRTDVPATRHLASALGAGVAVLPAVMAVFDAFFYNILMGTVFILLGCVGALWRIEIRDSGRRFLRPTAPAEVATLDPRA